MKQRIGYIDALRGFTMFLVVYYHVMLYTFGKAPSTWSISVFFATFRMPLFFFLSGFLMYKANRFKEGNSLKDFLRKKAKVQLFPTLIFSLLFALIFTISYKTLLLDKAKYGYWFTYTLFFYFTIYAVGDFIFSKLTKGKNKVLIGFVFSLLIYAGSKYSVVPSCPWFGTPINGIIGLPNFQYFLFFYFGALTRAYFSNFDRLFNQEKIITFIIVGFILIQLILQIPHSKEWFFANGYHPLYTLLQTFAGFWGIAAILIFFRKNEERIVNCQIGKYLQYIGVRTLDIYLIHNILVITDMHFIRVVLAKHGSIVTELILGGTVSMIIIGLCLVISQVIRCSDSLAEWLFGKVIK